jgi:hypothetical protein
MKPLLAPVLIALLVGAANAATPGAYSISEADPSSPKESLKSKNRCIGADQIDENGFLVPKKTLASNDGCAVVRTEFNRKDMREWLEWNAVCAGVIKYDVIQRNSGNDFEMDVLLTLASGTEKRIQFKASYLGRPCTSDDQPF